jgi:predicted GNAT family acetyltransferase
MDTEAGLAIADYRLNGFIMTIYHTEVPARLRGRGHGGRLVMGALSEARSKGYKIVPSCCFVREVVSASSKYDDISGPTALPNRGYWDAQAEQG